MKIGAKLAATISAVNLIGIGVLTISSLLFTSNQISTLAYDNAGITTEVTANQVRAFLEVPLDEIRALAQVMSSMDSIEAENRRTFINLMLHSLSVKNPDFVGVWTIFEPNALDGMDAAYVNTPGSDASGRFLSFFSHVNGNVVLAASVDYDNPGSAGEYYRISFRTGREAIVPPYQYRIGGRETLITSVTVPIRRNGLVIGVAGIDLQLTEIQDMVSKIRPLGEGFSLIFCGSGTIVAHPDTSRLGRKAQETESNTVGSHLEVLLSAITNGTNFSAMVFSPYYNSNMIFVTRPFSVGGSATPWTAAAIVPESTVMAPVYRMTTISIILGAVILALISLLILIVSHSIIAPLHSMEKVFQFIGEGDFTHSLEAKSKDEIGNISRSLNATLEKICKLIKIIKGEAEELAGIGTNLAANMNQTTAAIKQIGGNIHNIQGRAINQSASVTETNATMEQITGNINKLNEQVDKQASSVSQSSSAIEEMLANIKSVTQTLTKNMENVNALTSASEVGRVGLQDVAEDIKEIAHESEGLLEINAVMENIASQTNLLSMNAAIEAAHAGEAGKGFAVVADEIRKLAESSSDQSKTISDVLKKIKNSIDKITVSTENVLNKFEAIDKTIKIVADQEENIRNAMEEQGQGSKQILEAIGNLNDVTRQVKGESDEMREGSSEVIQEGRNLETITQEITGGMNEMASGAEQIVLAVNQVNDLTEANHAKIAILIKEVSRFKVE